MTETSESYSRLRIVFAGTPDFAAIHLQSLLDHQCQVVGVFTQPDRPAGRGKKLMASPVKQVALDNGIKVHQPQTFKDPEAQQALKALKPDVMVVVAYGLIIPESVLTIPKYGCINVHASILPRWRGAAPIQRAIEAGDAETGVTIMQMDVGLDTGDMLTIRRCPIALDETGGSLHDKLAQMGPPALLATLSEMADSSLTPTKQDDNLSTYAPKITKQEAAIDWQQPALALERKVRAFNPFPVAHCLAGEQPLRLWQASATDLHHQAEPGTVIGSDDTSVTIACGQGALIIKEAQLPGKKRLSMAEILRGNRQLFVVGQPLRGIAE